MALLTAISSTNCVVSQGASYSIATEPTVFESTYVLGEGGNYSIRPVVRQWKGSVALSASYSYVGLTKDAALAATDALRETWTKNVAFYAPTGEFIMSETYVTPEGMEDLRKTKPFQNGYHYQVAGSSPVLGARVNPVHENGSMWRVDVDVGVEVVAYYEQTTAPSRATLEALVAQYVSADSNAQLLTAGGGE